MANNKHTSRRALLKGAPSAALAIVAGGATAAHAAAPSPILELFREWQVLHAAADEPGISDEKCDAICDQYHRLEDQMLALPSTSAADLAAKLCAYTGFGMFDLHENVAHELWDEARELLSENGILLGSEANRNG